MYFFIKYLKDHIKNTLNLNLAKVLILFSILNVKIYEKKR